jgi:GT2 family glycosyltransferase
MISVVIVTYDSAACVAACLASVRDTLAAAELIVVDNGSRDDTVSVVRATAPDARIIENGENVGFGRACNTGADAASGSHLLFLNPDANVVHVRADELGRVLAAEPFGLVAPSLDGEDDRRRAETSWTVDYLSHTFETLRPRGWRPAPRRRRDERDVWVSGGMLLASRKEFIELGGFDPRYFLYYEDRDLSRRYRGAKLPIRNTDALQGRHLPGTSSASDGLRAEPMAWSLLGWLQYVCVRDGERTGRKAARASVTTLRMLRVAVRALAALRWERARRKARQLDEVLGFLRERASGDDTRFCPDALRTIRGLL